MGCSESEATSRVETSAESLDVSRNASTILAEVPLPAVTVPV